MQDRRSSADFIARLARAATPRQSHGDAESRYHGVFAPASALRQHIVPAAHKPRRRRTKTTQHHQQADKSDRNHHTAECAEPPTAPLSWAQRLKRVFNIDITRCPLCAGQLRVIEDVTDPNLTRKILDYRKQRAPPRRSETPAYPQQTRADLFAWHS